MKKDCEEIQPWNGCETKTKITKLADIYY